MISAPGREEVTDTIFLHTAEDYKYNVALAKKLILTKITTLPQQDSLLFASLTENANRHLG